MKPLFKASFWHLLCLDSLGKIVFLVSTKSKLSSLMVLGANYPYFARVLRGAIYDHDGPLVFMLISVVHEY